MRVRPTVFLVEQMSHAERRWDRAWAPFVAGHDAPLDDVYGFDPRACLPWVEEITVDGVEEMLEDPQAAPFDLTLRDADPRFPATVNSALRRISEEWVPIRSTSSGATATSYEDAIALADAALRARLCVRSLGQ
jgi:hypothetical protein